MAIRRIFLGDLTISSGGSDSGILGAKELQHVFGLLFVPGTLTNAVNIQVGMAEDTAIGSMQPLFADGTEVAIASGVTSYWECSGFLSVGAISEGNEGSERTISVYAILDM